MKKFAAVVSVAVLFAFAAPVFAATNPFMDVPMNHWAYDAIGQLAAHGILSGYPDGTYKGKQPTTRYEMASALARALAVVDMTKASKQDVEMLKKLIVEFKDELDALGVKVDGIDKRLAVIEDRLGGWKISGALRADILNWDNTAPRSDNAVSLTRARLVFERRFGEDESIKVVARLDQGSARSADDLGAVDTTWWSRFFAEIPFYWDSTLTVGRFSWDMEEDYYLGGSTSIFGHMEGGLDSVLTDRVVDGFGWQKSFGLGKVSAYVQHPGGFRAWNDADSVVDPTVIDLIRNGRNNSAWEFFFMAQLQFNEQFGFDFGFQSFWGDNAEQFNPTDPTQATYSFDSIWTLFAGLRFDFNPNVAFKGIYYKQSLNIDEWVAGEWQNYYRPAARRGTDSPDAWKVILDVKQEALKFTSLWLEYARYDQNFFIPVGAGSLFHEGMDPDAFGSHVIPNDTTIWRVGARQDWNEKWATFFYVSSFNVNDEGWEVINPAGERRIVDAKALQWGVGVTYQYNPNVAFGLSYSDINWKIGANNNGYADNHLLRFRTQVTF